MKKKPLGFDEKGRPVWAYNASGKPVCGASRKLGPCQSRARLSNGRCRLCGGRALTGPANPSYKHGEYSQETLRRKALLLRLAYSSGPSVGSTLDKVVEVLRKELDDGSFTAAKYVFDQLAGQPRTTTVYEISDADLLERVAAVTAEYIGPDLYPEWWGKVKESLESL